MESSVRKPRAALSVRFRRVMRERFNLRDDKAPDDEIEQRIR